MEIYSVCCCLFAGGVIGCAATAVYCAGRWRPRNAPQHPQEPAHPAGRSQGHRDTDKAVQIIREIRTVSGEITASLQQRQRQVATARQMAAQGVGQGESAQASLQSLHDLLQQDLEQLADFQCSCAIIQRNSENLESYVTDAFIDPVSGVSNRRAFDYELSRRFSDWNRDNTPLSLIMVDLDHFKRVNDTYGHQVGDEVLRCVAETLVHSLRDMDQVARYGGEEFAIILPNTDGKAARDVGDLLRRELEAACYEIREHAIKLTASVGVASAKTDDDPGSIVHRADIALYAAKNAGRNCVHIHNGLGCECVAAGDPDSKNTYANRDSVTGFHQGTVFQEFLNYRMAEYARYGNRFSVMLIRIDGFTQLSQLSLELSEKCLRRVARYLKSALRAVDLIARLENDHFVAILPATSLEEVLFPADRFRRAVSKWDKLRKDDVPLTMSVSIGAAEVREGDTQAALMRRLTDACQMAQSAGGNQIYGHKDDICIELDALSLLPELTPVS